jgi:hypothetical protein
MLNSSSIVNTKAFLAALRIILKIPETIDEFSEILYNIVYEK